MLRIDMVQNLRRKLLGRSIWYYGNLLRMETQALLPAKSIYGESADAGSYE